MLKKTLTLFMLLFVTQNGHTDEVYRSWSPPVFVKNLEVNGDHFSTPDSLKDEVQFWIKIYTQYTTQQGLFHISGEPSHILGEIDLRPIYANQNWGPIRKEKEAELFIRTQRKKIAEQFKIKKINSIRLQMGLKDRMQTAIIESGKYLPMMEEIFKSKGLPIELTRIVFVESSFNVAAQSKVGASGLWQIMPNIGQKFKYIKASYDKRNHPEFATKCAAEILSQNYKILKSWPLAITSYNFGVGSMLKVRRKMKTINSDEIFNSPHLKKHMGFASRNFYATFLAALYVESHANIYFGEPLLIGQEYITENVYTQKKVSVSELIQQHDLSLDKFKKMNPHLMSKYLKSSIKLPIGTLVTLPLSKEKVKTASELIEN